jgi:hypothetical protein
MTTCIVDDGTDALLDGWALRVGFSPHASGTSIRCYIADGLAPLDSAHHEWLSSRGFERLFESCYLPSNVQGDARRSLVHALFTELGGSRYRAEINLETNSGCYDALFSGAQPRIKGGLKRILDVGCGPGTILDAHLAASGQQLTGFDFVEVNQKEANARGLATIDIEESRVVHLEKFDLFLSAFVLHYESFSFADIVALSRLLRVDGIWAANFHKSRGLARFCDALERCGDFRQIDESVPSKFGPMIFARKAS